MVESELTQQEITLRPQRWRRVLWTLLGIVVLYMTYDLITSDRNLQNILLALLLVAVYGYVVLVQFIVVIRCTPTTLYFRDTSRGLLIAKKTQVLTAKVHAVYIGRPKFILDQLNGRHDNAARTFTSGAVVGMVAPLTEPIVITTRLEPWMAILTESGAVHAIDLKPYARQDYQKLIDAFQDLHIPIHVQQ